tara:strand:+ start:595 stop:828 length:234 start_codon:yes stop_codon:yes gene_type:complete
VVDEHVRKQNLEGLSKEELIKEVKNLQEINKYHQEQNGELREKYIKIRELRIENTKLREQLKEQLELPLVLTDEVKE